MKSQIILELVFRYWFFVWVFYFILKHGPFTLNLEMNGNAIEDEIFIELFLRIVCIFWIITIPVLFLKSLKNIYKSY